MLPVGNVLLYNQCGAIDPSRPFAVFGPQPAMGSYFMIGSRELFDQKAGTAVVQIEWQNLPPTFDFADYYSGYGVPIDVPSFKMAASYSQKGLWHPLPLSNNSLFQKATGTNDWVSRFEWGPLELAGADDFLRLELTEPSFGFGANLYAMATAEAVLKRRSPPNPPFTPIASGISVFLG